MQDANLRQRLLFTHAWAESGYWLRIGELDENEGKKEEALKAYREALVDWPVNRNDLLARQRRLWKELGRSDESWQAWVDSIPKSPDWPGAARSEFTAVHRVLPKVALKDLNGNLWSADRFGKKTTIAVRLGDVVWSVRQGVAVFRQARQRFKDSSDVQVVSFNADENPGLAEEFVKKNGYRFPVLLAKDFAESLMPYLSIPRTSDYPRRSHCRRSRRIRRRRRHMGRSRGRASE